MGESMTMKEKERRRYELQADVLKALAHPIRLAIIQFLSREEKCVCDIVDYVGTSQSNISKHLSIMKRAGILSDRKEGLSVYYRLNMPCALNFFQCVRDIMETQLSERAAAIQ
jgi:DNA-binding transcriptional ArsR family regulator